LRIRFGRMRRLSVLRKGSTQTRSFGQRHLETEMCWPRPRCRVVLPLFLVPPRVQQRRPSIVVPPQNYCFAAVIVSCIPDPDCPCPAYSRSGLAGCGGSSSSATYPAKPVVSDTDIGRMLGADINVAVGLFLLCLRPWTVYSIDAPSRCFDTRTA